MQAFCGERFSRGLPRTWSDMMPMAGSACSSSSSAPTLTPVDAGGDSPVAASINGCFTAGEKLPVETLAAPEVVVLLQKAR